MDPAGKRSSRRSDIVDYGGTRFGSVGGTSRRVLIGLHIDYHHN
jgi:hypothetical protein